METHLRQIRRHFGLKQSQLAEVLDCSKENISMIETGKSSLSERNKRCLVKKFNLDPAWLAGEDVAMVPSRPGRAAGFASGFTEGSGSGSAGVPLYDMEKIPSLAELFGRAADGGRTMTAGAGAGTEAGRQSVAAGTGRQAGSRSGIGRRSGVVAGVGRQTKEERRFAPVGWISIPGLPDCDGAVRVAGDGMSPILRSGDIVIYKKLDSAAEIFWGEEYLISVKTSAGEYVSVRYVRRSEKDGWATLAGENPAFADIEVELSKICALAFVKASIHSYSTK